MKLRHRDKIVIRLVLAFLFVAAIVALNPSIIRRTLSQHNPGNSNVVEVIDGDTIVVRLGGKNENVRLIGVDTPELHHPKKPVQCYGAEARDFTIHWLGSQSVRLVADPEDDNRDIYGRLLRYVYLPDGQMLNQALTAQGYGFAYTVFPFTKKPIMVAAEVTAKDHKLGLWSHCQVHREGDTEQTNPT